MEPTSSPELGLLPFERAATLVAHLGFVLVHDEHARRGGRSLGARTWSWRCATSPP